MQALAGGKTSGATSFTWTVDLTAPAVTIAFPANGGSYSAASWNAGCAPNVGVCGTATDASGVASGSASILQQSSGKYWNGSSFSSATEVLVAATATGGSGTSFSGYVALAAPPSGTYVVHARANDNAGNTTPAGSQATATFTIDAGITGTFTNPSNGNTYTSGTWPRSFTGTASDAGGSGVASVDISISRDNQGNCYRSNGNNQTGCPNYVSASGTTSWSFSVTYANLIASMATGNDPVTATIRVTDNVGNQVTFSITITVVK